MTLDEEQADVLLRELALLHDSAILDEAVGYLIQKEERFPPIARIRLAYRSVNDAHSAARSALARAAEPAGDRGVPKWAHVWEWRRRQTLTARQAANTTALGPVEDRPPVRMRDFPQFEMAAADAYTLEEYEQIREAWIKAGSPGFGSVAELVGDVVGAPAVG